MRNTFQKSTILATVRGMISHPSADEVYTEVLKKIPSISRATVYRNLGSMAEEGLIRRIAVANAPDRFDFNLEDHCHCRCNICGAVYDHPFKIEFLSEDFLNEEFTATGYEFVINGVCRACKLTKT